MPTARISLAYRIESRKNDLTKDSRSVNALIESQGEGEAPRIVKRPGLSQINCTPALPTGVGQGVFTWNNQIIAACNNNIFGISGGNSTNYGSIVGSTVPLNFSKTSNDTYLAFHDGSNFYVLTKSTLAITTPISGGTINTVSINTAGGPYNTCVKVTSFTATNPAVFTVPDHNFTAGAFLGTLFIDGSITAGTGTNPISDGMRNKIVSNIGYTLVVYNVLSSNTFTLAWYSPVSGGVWNAIDATNQVLTGDIYFTNGPAVTMTIGSPCVVTRKAHGLSIGQGIYFVTTGSLPTGLLPNTNYVVAPTGFTADTFQVASSYTPTVSINTSGTQSGLHTLQINPNIVSSASPGTTAVISSKTNNASVIDSVLINPGSGYTSVPTLTVESPTPILNKTAVVRLLIGGASCSVESSGAGYTSPPTITNGTGSFTAQLTNGCVTKVIVNNAGNATLGLCTVSAPSGISAATATAAMNNTINGPFARGLVYMDGYLFMMATNGRIYQSNYEDPTTWGALNYVTAESDPDKGVAIVRHQNYLVAFGSWSTDFFYNAGNPTGSILSVNKSAKLEIGCAAGGSVVGLEQAVIWVGQAQSRGRSVYMMSGTAPQKISTRHIDKYLNADTMENVFAYVMKISGHTLYILTLRDSNITFTYDIDEKAWIQWTSQSGNVETYFKYLYFTSDIEANSSLYVQHETNGHVYEVNPDLYTDEGDSIFFRSVTNLLDSNSNKRKFITKVEIIGDKVAGTLSIRHTDDDYATWSNYRTVDLSKTRPILYQGGSTRRRAYEVFSSDNIPIRLEAMEMEFDLGEQGGGQEG